ncbi:hypothetical protein ACA910_000741 [Epithemia clementina (nom. ined.)]
MRLRAFSSNIPSQWERLVPDSCRPGRQLSSAFSTATSTTSDKAPLSLNKTGVGFVGLGNMGFPMAQNLARSSALFKDILVFDKNSEACGRAADIEGVRVANDLEELASQPLIITMLPGDAAVNAVLKILYGLWIDEPQQPQDLSSPKLQRVVIDCSTVSPSTSIQWSKTLQESKSAILFDAPVSGGVKGATDGTLTFMLGGCSSLNIGNNNDGDICVSDQTTINVKFVLEQMGSRVIECGSEVGAGAATKLCNNLALASQMIGICEALNLGESLGVDPIVLSSVLNSSTAACWSSKINNPHPKVAATTGAPASRNYQGGFATNLMLKDLGLAMQVANEKHVALPLTSTSKELFQIASLQGKGLDDFGSVIQVLKGGNEKKE